MYLPLSMSKHRLPQKITVQWLRDKLKTPTRTHDIILLTLHQQLGLRSRPAALGHHRSEELRIACHKALLFLVLHRHPRLSPNRHTYAFCFLTFAAVFLCLLPEEKAPSFLSSSFLSSSSVEMVYKLRKGLVENGILRYDKEYADAAEVTYLIASGGERRMRRKKKKIREEAKGQETCVGWKVIENGGQKQHEENEVGEMTIGMKRRTRSTNNRQSEFGDVRRPIGKAREECRGGCRLVSSLR